MTPSFQSDSDLAECVAHEDPLYLLRDGRPDYMRIVTLTKLSKVDLSKLGGVQRSSVRLDEAIPELLAVRLREVASIANLVAKFFDGDAAKVSLWFELSNPLLGDMSPSDMVRVGRHKRLLNVVLDACRAGLPAPKT